MIDNIYSRDVPCLVQFTVSCLVCFGFAFVCLFFCILLRSSQNAALSLNALKPQKKHEKYILFVNLLYVFFVLFCVYVRVYRYEVVGNQGRGVFSTVLRVRHIENNREYVIKVIRNREQMYKSGQKEINFLIQVSKHDPNNRSHCVKLFDAFDHRSHLCLVFEPMLCNLRQLIKKVGAGKGFNIGAVFLFARQLFKALKLLKQLSIIHSDIKPDNILVNSEKNVVKLCDFGSGYTPDEIEVTPVLGSRFYRAPEVMLGLLWNCPIDMWAMGCVLFELYTGRILFSGDDNNAMLKLIFQVCGQFPIKLGKNGSFWYQHFDENGIFLEDVNDQVSGMKIKVRHNFNQIKSSDRVQPMKMLLGSHFGMQEYEINKLREFEDLLEKMLCLDPNKRITPDEALKHPFCKNGLNNQRVKR